MHQILTGLTVRRLGWLYCSGSLRKQDCARISIWEAGENLPNDIQGSHIPEYLGANNPGLSIPNGTLSPKSGEQGTQFKTTGSRASQGLRSTPKGEQGSSPPPPLTEISALHDLRDRRYIPTLALKIEVEDRSPASGSEAVCTGVLRK